MTRAHLILGVIVLILLAPPAVVVAQTLTHTASAEVDYVTNSDVQVTLGDGREVASQPFVGPEEGLLYRSFDWLGTNALLIMLVAVAAGVLAGAAAESNPGVR